MLYGHSALKFAGANTQEGDPIAVCRIHVSLNLEHISAEFLVRWLDKSRCTLTRLRLRCKLQEVLQESLYPEVIDRTTEEDRCQFPTSYLLIVKRIPSNIKQFYILAQLVMKILSSHFPNCRVIIIFDLLNYDR
ncbi:hypothetical protein D3C86_1604560 [compost metagenome]